MASSARDGEPQVRVAVVAFELGAAYRNRTDDPTHYEKPGTPPWAHYLHRSHHTRPGMHSAHGIHGVPGPRPGPRASHLWGDRLLLAAGTSPFLSCVGAGTVDVFCSL